MVSSHPRSAAITSSSTASTSPRAIRTGEHAFRWTCYYWEKARAEVPGWPDTAAPIIPRRKLVWLPWSAFPPSLERDIDAYYACRVQAREFDIDTLFDGTPRKRIRANTARNYKEYLQGVASAAVAAGVSAEDIHHLADLLGPAVLERAITQLVKRRAQLAGRSGANAPSMELPAGRYTFDASSLFGVGGNDRSCLPTDVFRFG
jgi:hypothetical protein